MRAYFVIEGKGENAGTWFLMLTEQGQGVDSPNALIGVYDSAKEAWDMAETQATEEEGAVYTTFPRELLTSYDEQARACWLVK